MRALPDFTGGVFPTKEELYSFIHELGSPPTEKGRVIQANSDMFHAQLRASYAERRLFRMSDGLLGSGPRSALASDSVWILAGAQVPMFLRLMENGHYQFIGEAYMDGLMKGELVATDTFRLETIILE